MGISTSEFDYELPEELIAQSPAERRDQSRLLVLDRETGAISHNTFRSIPGYLHTGDLVVANRTRVIPARLVARKETGGSVQLLLLRPAGDRRWTALARPSRKLRPGMLLSIPESNLTVRLEALRGDGEWSVCFAGCDDVDAALKQVGTIPLPPYIRNLDAPPDRYQTVYADRDGSVAAPTAGLHFSAEIMAELNRKGVDLQFITLHVGLGTFRPVTVERIADHRMHAEWGEVPADVAASVRRARASGGRIVAVGTTSTRLLESAAGEGDVREFSGDTDMFIYPGYRFKVVDALVTNFHLPRSSLLMLVSALAGRELIMAAYREAIRERYRFFSFGDAMLIL